MTRFVLVRHGQTDWNRVERFHGRADVPLNASGLSQAEATARRVAREWRPVAIYASPLSRAFATAEQIGRQTHLAVTRLDGVIDIDYGVWEGLTPDEVFGRWPDLLYAWYNAPHTAQPPGGESLAALRERAMQSIDEFGGATRRRDGRHRQSHRRQSHHPARDSRARHRPLLADSSGQLRDQRLRVGERRFHPANPERFEPCAGNRLTRTATGPNMKRERRRAAPVCVGRTDCPAGDPAPLSATPPAIQPCRGCGGLPPSRAPCESR